MAKDDEEKEAGWRPDALFVGALVFSLRAEGLRVSLADAAACLGLLRARPVWRRDELAPVLALALARGADDGVAIERVVARLFDGPPPPPVPVAPPIKDGEDRPPRPGSQVEDGWADHRLSVGGTTYPRHYDRGVLIKSGRLVENRARAPQAPHTQYP